MPLTQLDRTDGTTVRAHNLTEKLDTSGSLKDTAALVQARCAMR